MPAQCPSLRSRRRWLRILTLIVAAIVALAAAPAAFAADLSRGELRDQLAAAMAGDGSAGGAWVFDADAGGDGLLFSDNGSEARIPASNQKLFTTAAFLAELGADARLETRVYARGQARRSRRLGRRRRPGASSATATRRSARPDFARANDQPVTRVSQLARNVARAGIKRIEGRVLADDTIFDRERRAGPDLSPLSGLSFNNGYVDGHYAGAPELVAAKALKDVAAQARRRGLGPGRPREPAAEHARPPNRSPRSPRRRSRS